MQCTLFRRVETDDEVYYEPEVLDDCFFSDTSGLKFVAQGENLNNNSTAVVPISSLSSIDEVSPNESDPPKIYGGSDLINKDDFIALGVFEGESYDLSDLSTMQDCFCIKVIRKSNYSSLPCYLLKGE
jgi:hypothetical protein